MGIPNAVPGPYPPTGILGGGGFLAGHEAREIHAPEVAFTGRERTFFSFGEPRQPTPGEGKLDRPAAVAVVIFVNGAVDMNGGLFAGVEPVEITQPPAAGMGLEVNTVEWNEI